MDPQAQRTRWGAIQGRREGCLKRERIKTPFPLVDLFCVVALLLMVMGNWRLPRWALLEAVFAFGPWFLNGGLESVRNV